MPLALKGDDAILGRDDDDEELSDEFELPFVIDSLVSGFFSLLCVIVIVLVGVSCVGVWLGTINFGSQWTGGQGFVSGREEGRLDKEVRGSNRCDVAPEQE